MLISHPRGLYTIMVSEARRVVYEAPIGEWTVNDYKEYQALYEYKIRGHLGAGEWAICSDLRKYRLSEIEELISNQIGWYTENEVRYAAIIVDSVMIQKQMKRAISSRLHINGFLDEAEADEWLRSLGF